MKRVIARVVYKKNNELKPVGIRIICDDSTAKHSYTQDIDEDTIVAMKGRGEVAGYDIIDKLGLVDYATEEIIRNVWVACCKTVDENDEEKYILVDAGGEYKRANTEEIINSIQNGTVANLIIDGMEINFSDGTEVKYNKELDEEKINKFAISKIKLVNNINRENIKFEVSEDTLVRYCGNETIVNIPSGIRVIGKGAFAENNVIETVIFSDSVVKIDEEAFRKCTKLSDVKLNKGLKYICKKAFEGCYSIREIILPKNLNGENLGFAALATGDRILKVHMGWTSAGKQVFGPSPRIYRDSNL